MIFKNIKLRIMSLVILNIVATFFWGTVIWNRYEGIQAMADGKIPVTIIMYHSILKDRSRAGDYVISPDQFESDIKYLSDNGYTFITVTDIINFVNKKWSTLPDKPVVITFDDGYYNNYVYAYPIIKKYDAKFVFSILGKYTDINIEGQKLNPYYSHVTWDQLKEMDKSGHVEVQNHSYDLHTVTNKRSGSLKNKNETEEEYKEFFINDVMKLQKLLKKNAGLVPNTYTYPFGKISPQSVEILKDLDFEAALTCYGGINYIGKDDEAVLFKLKRYNRPNGKSSESYFKGKLE